MPRTVPQMVTNWSFQTVYLISMQPMANLILALRSIFLSQIEQLHYSNATNARTVSQMGFRANFRLLKVPYSVGRLHWTG